MTAKPNGSKMKNVYSYTRWSTDKQGWGDSERRLEALAKKYCALTTLIQKTV
jgi:hypothetical protein